MDIALVGPAYPWRGGLPLLVTDLTHHLAVAGHHVHVHTWSHPGPRRVLPHQQHLATPERAVYPAASERLSWRSPTTWRTVGRAIRNAELVIIVHFTSVQAPTLAAVAHQAHSPVVVICANAVPHEPRHGDRVLTALLLSRATGILVHTHEEANAVTRISQRPVAAVDLPPHLPVTLHQVRRPLDAAPTRRLAFLGKIRAYKGLDLLIRAVAELEHPVTLQAAGEPHLELRPLHQLIQRLNLQDRVNITPGYLPADQLPELLNADALVMPYRTATASQHVALAHTHRVVPVATRVGNFPKEIRDGVDGLLCQPGDVHDLTRALQQLYQPGQLHRLRAAIHSPDDASTWETYITTMFNLAHNNVKSS